MQLVDRDATKQEKLHIHVFHGFSLFLLLLMTIFYQSVKAFLFTRPQKYDHFKIKQKKLCVLLNLI